MCIHCLCAGQRMMNTTARVITVGFITATDRAASKTQAMSTGVCLCVCVCVSAFLDKLSTKMASKDNRLTGMK